MKRFIAHDDFGNNLNLSGQDFIDFVTAHEEEANVFSLTQNVWIKTWRNLEYHNVLKRLKPFHIKTVKTNYWFARYLFNGKKHKIYIYRFNTESKKILLDFYRDLFFIEDTWSVPEDLCFFNGDELITGTVSHEGICCTFLDDLQVPGMWETCSSSQYERIKIHEDSRKLN